MKIVYICSPLKGQILANIIRANKYCKQAANKGVMPLAPHVIFSQFLDDNNPDDREHGMTMGIELLYKCDELWVYGEPSEGMKAEIKLAQELNMPIKYHDSKGGEYERG